MILEKHDILKLIEEGELKIEPFDEKLLGIDSIDVRLSNYLLVAEEDEDTIDPFKPKNFWREVRIDEEGFELTPGMFVLGSTIERVGLGNTIAGLIHGRSSVGRLGIMVHVTAGMIHAGFGKLEPSRITLEMYSVNPNPVLLKPGMRIAQLAFVKLSRPSEELYDEVGKYVGLKKPTPPEPLEK